MSEQAQEGTKITIIPPARVKKTDKTEKVKRAVAEPESVKTTPLNGKVTKPEKLNKHKQRDTEVATKTNGVVKAVSKKAHEPSKEVKEAKQTKKVKEAKEAIPKPEEKKTKKKTKVPEDGTSTTGGSIKKPHRYRAGTRAAIEVRQWQNGKNATKNLIPKATIYRMVRDTITAMGDFRVTPQAIEALRAAVEMQGIKIMASANRLAGHANRKTVMLKDLEAVDDIRSMYPGVGSMNMGGDIILLEGLPSLPSIGSTTRPRAIKAASDESSRVTEFKSGDEGGDEASTTTDGMDTIGVV